MTDKQSISQSTLDNPLYQLIIASHCIPSGKTAKEALQDFRKLYPEDEQWRLLVDGALYGDLQNINTTIALDLTPLDKHGWKDYENREPGCIKGFFIAWQCCLNEIERHPERTDLTLEFILTLHRLVSSNVSGEIHTHSYGAVNCKMTNECEDCNGRVRYQSSQFMLGYPFKHRYTEEGIKSLVIAILNNELPEAHLNADEDIHDYAKSFDQQYIRNLHDDSQNRALLYILPTPENTSFQAGTKFVTRLMSKNIEMYNTTIKSAKSDDEKIAVIGKTIQQFERIHPFTDANGRTFVNLLLNYLLIKEGFPPATMVEPNLFDAFGFTSEVIQNGIANTLEIYHGNKNLFGFSITDTELINQMRAIMADAKAAASKIAQTYSVTKTSLFIFLENDKPTQDNQPTSMNHTP